MLIPPRRPSPANVTFTDMRDAGRFIERIIVVVVVVGALCYISSIVPYCRAIDIPIEREAPVQRKAVGIHCSGGARVVSTSNTFDISSENAIYAEVEGTGSDFAGTNDAVILRTPTSQG
jgi:hypothetical protein